MAAQNTAAHHVATVYLARLQLEQAQTQHMNHLQLLRVRLRLLFVEFPVEFAELLGAVVGVLWGITTLNPYADTFGSAPSFRMLAEIAPEWMWGSLVFLGGLQALVALFWGGWLWRVISTGLGCLTWMFMGYLFFSANPAGLALALYLPLAGAAAYANLRLAARRGIGWGV